jgi:uncharacterized protein YcsI (UPF0317 family)
MQSITIVWKPIDATGGLAYHEFLLYDDGTNTYYLRGGPGSGSSEGSASSGSGSDSGPGTGPITVKSGVYEAGTPDFPTGPDAEGTLADWPQQNIISGDLDLSSTWSSMVNSANAIGAANVPYDLITRNSNSVVGSVLDQNGFTPPDPPGLTPGWNNIIRLDQTTDSQGRTDIDAMYDGGSTHTVLNADGSLVQSVSKLVDSNGQAEEIETDNGDGTRTITGYDETGNENWQLAQAADGSGTFVGTNGSAVAFAAGQFAGAERASDGSAVLFLSPNADGVPQQIGIGALDGAVTVSLGTQTAFTAPVGTQITVDDAQGIVATLPTENGATQTIALGPDGTLTNTLNDTNSQGDPIQVSDEPDPATGTVSFKSVTDNGQTTQVGSGDSADTDGGLQESLAKLAGTNPAADEPGSSVTDPGNHPPNDPQAPFTAEHPSPADPRDPLVLDLVGAGINLSSVTQSSAHFDFTGSGFATKTGWITPGEGLLVLDGNPSAPININELVGAASGDGFADLAALDGDGNGVIDASDPTFARLSVWVDANGDGQLDPGELVSLSSLGITSISLSSTPSGQTINGNTLVSTSTFEMNGTGGSVTNAIGEVDLATNPVESRYTPPAGFAHNSAVFSLPQLIGYGTVPNLWVAMSQNPQLLADVKNLVMNAASMSAAQFDAAFQAILWEWVGATNLDPNSRGSYIDARHLAVDYAFYGIDQTTQPLYQINPNWHSGPIWQTIYQSIVDELEARFVGQLAAGQLLNGVDPASIVSSWFTPFSAVKINLHNDTVSVNFNSLVQQIVSGAPADPTTAAVYYQQMMPFVRDLKVDLFSEQDSGITAACLAACAALGYGTDIQTALLTGLGESLLDEGANGGALTTALANSAVLLGTGDKSVTGGSNDVYVYTPAAGNDRITDRGAQAAIVLAGLNPDDVSFYRSGPTFTDLTIANNATGKTLTVVGEFSTPNLGAGSVVFGDGTVWQTSTIDAKTYITAASSSSGSYDTSNLGDPIGGTIIYDLGAGTFGNVTAWHDQAIEIVWGAGDSSQTFLIEGRFGNVGSLLLRNLNPGDVTFYRSGSNFGDLTIQNNTTGATLTLTGQIANWWEGVTSITFADGTVWQASTIAGNSYIRAASSTSGSYDASLYFNYPVIYDLGTGTFGNVTAHRNGAVEVIWGAGDSSQAFTIDGDADNDNVGSLILNGLTPSDVSFYRSGANFADLTIADKATGSTVTFYGELSTAWYGVATITFADGTVWHSSDIAANSYITAASSTTGSYDASLYFNYPVIYDLGTGTFGNVTAHRNGAVEVIWGAGDSSQAFSIDGDANFDNVGSLILNNLNPTDVSVYRSGANFADLTIANKGTGKTLTFYGEFGSSAWGVASVTFDNGTVWHASDIDANSYITAASSTTGSYDSNNITGAIAYDLGTGTFGNVTAWHDQAVEVIWGAGDSSQTFLIEGRFGNVGSLVLSNLNPGDVTFYRSGSNFGDLTIQNNTSGATLTLTGQIANWWEGVTSISFANGTVWPTSAIAANSYIRAASSASGSYDTSLLFNNPVIYDLGTGTFGNVNASRDGTVKVIWGAGDSSQQFTINGDGNNNNVGTLALNGLNPSDVLLYRSGPSLADLIIQNKTTGHTLTFSGEFSASWNGVASVTFADGTVWNQAQIAANTPNLMTTPTDTGNLPNLTYYLGPADYGNVNAFHDDPLTVEWARGDGSQTFTITSNNINDAKVVLLGLNPSDVSLIRTGGSLSFSNLTIVNNTTGKTLTLQNQFAGSLSGINAIDFANGTIWQTSTLAANSYITAASSASGSYDTSFLFNYPVIYDLGTGTFGNVNASHDGAVKVIWGAGDSSQQFTINGDGNNNNVGTLVLNNLNPSDVSFYRSGPTFTDLTIANKTTGATLTLYGELANSWYGVASATFGNGTVWQAAAIAAASDITAESSSSGAYNTNDLGGNTVYDLGTGTFGNVTAWHDQAVEIIWGAGDSSQTFLIEGRFGNVGSLVLSNLNPADVTFYRSGSNASDLTIRNNTTGATLTLTGQMVNWWEGVTSITFANGTVWQTSDIAANTYIRAASSTSGVYDTNNLSGNTVYDLGTGTFGTVTAWHDQAVEVIWGAGHSSQTILIEGRFGNVGSLVLGNLNPGDVTFYRSGSNASDLTIQNNTTGATLTLTGQMVNWWEGVTSITFGNGTVWQTADIAANTYIRAASSTSGVYDTNNLSGTTIYDLGTGTFGNVTAWHDQGVEVIWGVGDSSQTILIEGRFGNVGSLVLGNLNPTDVSFYASGTNLSDQTIKNNATGATLTLTGEVANWWEGATSITFGNGAFWLIGNALGTPLDGSTHPGATAAYFRDNVTVNLATGTANINGSGTKDTLVGIHAAIVAGANDTIIGDNAGDTLSATGSNDIIHGGTGNDILIINGGTDTFFGGGGNDTFEVLSATVTPGLNQPQNLIADFNPGNPNQLIDLSRYTGIRSFADLHFSTVTLGGQSYLQVGLGNTGQAVMLSGVTANQLSASNFVFASPTLTVHDASGGEDQPIALSISARENDPNGTLSLAISGIPANAILSNSQGALTFSNGSITFTSAQLAGGALNGLSITPPSAANFALTVTATTQDGTSFLATTQTMQVIVAPLVPALIISGTAQEGQALAASAVTSDGDVTIGYQWQSSSDGQTWSNISGSTGSTYTAQENDEGLFLRVSATATDAEGNSTSATSAATAAVVDKAPTLSVSVSGTAQEGQVITAVAVANDADAVVTYQWQSLSGATWSNISGATDSTYSATAADDGHQLRVVTSSTDSDGSGTTATSTATASVMPVLSVTVSGAAQEGQALNATVVGNGVNAVITYQWQSFNGTTWSNIAGATNASYAVTEADEGTQLRVIATSTDGGGTTVTSAATNSVIDIAPSLLVTINGTAQEGQTVTAVAVANDADAAVVYQWQSFNGTIWSNLAGAAGSTYTVTETDEGNQLRVVVTLTDADGSGTTAPSAATSAVADIAPTLSVTVSGTAQEGQTLTASATANDSDAIVAYQWQSLTGSTWSNISGATGSVYSATEADEGHQLRVIAASSDSDGSGTSATSAATAAVVDIAPTLSVSVSGTSQEGHTLTASAVANDADAVITYQWQSLTGSTWSNISGATAATYTGAESDEGHQLRVVATSGDPDGSGTTATSTATAAVVDIAPTLSVTVSGTAQEGQTLTASAVANDSDAVVTYQWQSLSGSTWSNISGATGSTYTAAEADEDHQLRVVATSSDSDGSGTTATSAATVAVIDITPTLSVTVSGTAQEAQILTATATANDSDAVITYQWQSLSGSTWSNISGATAVTYTAVEADEGHQLHVVATSTDGDGSGTTATSAATAAVTDITPTLSVTVSGTAQEGQVLTASAVANDSDAIVTYQWQSLTGSTWSNISGATSSTFLVGEANEGHQLRVVATSSDSDGGGTTATSAATATVTDIAPTLTVSVSGTAQEGKSLTASAVANDSDAVITYQWQSLSGSTWSNISGATSSTYTAAEADEGHQVRVVATSSDSDGSGTSATSSATTAVVDVTPTLTVSVSGTAQEGKVLTATATATSDSDGGTTTYQWQSLTGTTWSNISAATATTYTAAEADEGHQLRVVATFVDDTGQSVSATSSATAAVIDVAPTLSVTIGGTAQEGQTLTANAIANDADAVVTYQWQSLSGTTWSNISGATSATFLVGEANETHQLRVIATSSDSDGSGTSATSTATAAVTDAPPTLSVTVSGTAREGQTLTATATANDSDATIKYQWQSLSGSTWSNITNATSSTYKVAETNEGHQLRVVATSSDTDGSGTTANSAATAAVTDVPPTLTITSNSITVAAGGSVALSISETSSDSDDTLTLTIAGLTTYETITDKHDSTVFSGSSVTLTSAEVSSGLTLHSSYTGTGHPVNTLTVTANNTTAGEAVSSASQTITVTDPPLTTSSTDSSPLTSVDMTWTDPNTSALSWPVPYAPYTGTPDVAPTVFAASDTGPVLWASHDPMVSMTDIAGGSLPSPNAAIGPGVTWDDTINSLGLGQNARGLGMMMPLTSPVALDSPFSTPGAGAALWQGVDPVSLAQGGLQATGAAALHAYEAMGAGDASAASPLGWWTSNNQHLMIGMQ